LRLTAATGALPLEWIAEISFATLSSVSREEDELSLPAPIIALSQLVQRRQRLGGMLNYYHHAAV
jgi:hypothetical protein